MKMRNEINDLAAHEIKKNLMFLKQRYYEGGLKSIKILIWKHKKKIAQNTIHKIKNPLTKLIKSKLNEIQGAFETFNRTPYTRGLQSRSSRAGVLQVLHVSLL